MNQLFQTTLRLIFHAIGSADVVAVVSRCDCRANFILSEDRYVILYKTSYDDRCGPLGKTLNRDYSSRNNKFEPLAHMALC